MSIAACWFDVAAVDVGLLFLSFCFFFCLLAENSCKANLARDDLIFQWKKQFKSTKVEILLY
jgi:hypothetical protein